MEKKYPIRPKEGLNFQIESFDKKLWQKWDNEKKEFIKSMAWQQGFTAKYIFNLVDGNKIELSKEQLGQVFIGAFEEKKHWKECKFWVKTNGKTGMDIRYFINVARENTGYEQEKELTVEDMPF